jgi:NAD(P)-dependent dehydrogenase (short-subunit alcohol dehydrogenase family)
MHDQYGLDGRAAIVTGASRGIGRVVAERIADEGVDVTICSRDEGEITETAAAIDDAYPGECIGVECDVRDRDRVAAMVQETVEAFGGVDYLVNNAGASFMAGFDDISENGWDSVIGVNLEGTVNCTQLAGEHLKDGGGVVVNFASVAGQQGAPYMSHYAAAKAAIINLTRTLAAEWAPEDVRVNCIAPGFVATPGVASQMGVTADEVERDEVKRRIGVSEEIADVAQFLASPAASFLTGETIAPQGVPQTAELPDS